MVLSCIQYVMSQKKIKGTGRLIPTRPTGVEYQVQYGIQSLESCSSTAEECDKRWEKCSLRSAHAQRIPDGSYFLHADDGRVHQVMSVDGEWRCLAVAA